METFSVEAIELQGAHNPANYNTNSDKNEEEEKEPQIVYGEETIIKENIESHILCDACNKKFTANSSLKRHLERSPVCKKWISLEKPNVFYLDNMSIVEFIENIKNKITASSDNEQCCKHCKSTYSSVGNLNKHYKTSIACNSLAYNEFQEEINKMIALTKKEQ